MKEEVTSLKEKVWGKAGFYLVYVSAVTEINETIKGFSIYLFNKQVLTISRSNGLWLKENDEPYGFALEGKVLYLRKTVIEFGDDSPKNEGEEV